jgi:hypothetical protein
MRGSVKSEYGRRDCKKTLKGYVELMSNCAQNYDQPYVNTLKPAVQACIKTEGDNFTELVQIINFPKIGNGRDIPSSDICKINFKLTQTESHSRLKNIIRENLIKLSIRKGLI